MLRSPVGFAYQGVADRIFQKIPLFSCYKRFSLWVNKPSRKISKSLSAILRNEGHKPSCTHLTRAPCRMLKEVQKWKDSGATARSFHTYYRRFLPFRSPCTYLLTHGVALGIQAALNEGCHLGKTLMNLIVLVPMTVLRRIERLHNEGLNLLHSIENRNVQLFMICHDLRRYRGPLKDRSLFMTSM